MPSFSSIKHLMEFVPLPVHPSTSLYLSEELRLPLCLASRPLACRAEVKGKGMARKGMAQKGSGLHGERHSNLKFWNSTFDKGRLKSFVSWFLKTYGEKKTIELLEQFKNLGFGYATQAGVSLGIDDLLIPPEKMTFLSVSNKTVFQSNSKYKNAKITAVEKIQLFIDIWNETSENLKKEVVRYFEKTNIFNPVYMMAFSGARGNISQVRQLVGMRGLMSDPQGNIIDFPIQSNFREGLTLTEYIISTYGARKGIVDTALRTATAGYLTRRLVDVAQHVMISLFDCKTNRGIFVFDMKEGNQTISSFQNRLVGRVLANDMFVTDTRNKSLCIGYRNQEISNELATKMAQLAKKAFVRSPLTCQSSKFVCQLCYGWSLSRNKLVSLGEAVGVIAGQSIGEPGTQLTMRTFHTGGVFSGGLTESVVANYDGWIEYLEPIPGTCIRTLQGKIAFLTKAESSFLLKQKTTFSEMVPNSKESIFLKGPGVAKEVPGTPKATNNLGFHKIPGYAILFARHKQFIFKKQILAQFSSGNQFKTQKGNAEQTVYADLEGEIFFNQIDVLEQKSNYFMQDTLWKSYYKSKIWILAGKIYQNKFFGIPSLGYTHPKGWADKSFYEKEHGDSDSNRGESGKFTNFLVQNRDFVNRKSVFERVSWQSSNQNIIEFSSNSLQRTMVPNFSSMKNKLNLENSDLYVQRNAEQSKFDLRKTYFINKFFLFNTFKKKSFKKMKNPSSIPGGTPVQLKSGLHALNSSGSKTLDKFLLNYQKIKTKDFYSLGFSQNLNLQIPSIYLYNKKFRSIFKRKYNLMDLSKKLTKKSFLTYFNKTMQSKIRFSAQATLMPLRGGQGEEQGNVKMNQTDFSTPEQKDIIEFRLRQIKQKNMKFLANSKNQEIYIPNFLKKTPLKILEKNPVWISKSFSYKTNSNFNSKNSKIVKFSINKKNKFLQIFSYAEEISGTKRKFLSPQELQRNSRSGTKVSDNLFTKKFLTNKLDKKNSLSSSPSMSLLFPEGDPKLLLGRAEKDGKEGIATDSCTLEKLFYIYETNFSKQNSNLLIQKSGKLCLFMAKGKDREEAKNDFSVVNYSNPGVYSSVLTTGTKTSSMQVIFKNKFLSGNFSKQNSSSFLKVSNLPNSKLLKTPLLFVSLNKILFQSMGYIFEISDSKPSVPFVWKEQNEFFRKTLVRNSRKKYQNQTENYKIFSFFPLNQTNFSVLSKNALKKPYLKKSISPYNNENIKPNPSTIFHWFPEKQKTESGIFMSFKSNKKWNFQTNFWIQKKRFQKTNSISNSSIFSNFNTNCSSPSTLNGSSAPLRIPEFFNSKKFPTVQRLSYQKGMMSGKKTDNLKKLKQIHFRKLYSDTNFVSESRPTVQNKSSSSHFFIRKELDHAEQKDFQKFSVPTEKFYWIPQQNYNFSSNFFDFGSANFKIYSEKSIFLERCTERVDSKNFYLVNRQGKKKQVQFEISGLTLAQESFFPYAKLNYSNLAQEGTKAFKSRVLSNYSQNKFFLSSLLKKTNKQILKSQLNKKFNSFLLDSELKNLLLKNLKKKFFSLSKVKSFSHSLNNGYVNLSNSQKQQSLNGAGDSLAHKSASFSQFFTLFPYSKKSKNKIFSQPNLLTKKNFKTSFYSKNLNITMKPGWVYVFSKKNCTPEIFSFHQTFFKSGHNFLHDVNFEQHPVFIENCIFKNCSESFSDASSKSSIPSFIPLSSSQYFQDKYRSAEEDEGTTKFVPPTSTNIRLKRFSKKIENKNCRYIVNKEPFLSGKNLALLIRPIYSKILPNSSSSKTLLVELNKNLNNIKSSSFLIKDYHSNLLNKQFLSEKTFLSGCYLDFQINRISPLLNLQKKPLWFHTNRLKTENQENTKFALQSPVSLFEFLPIRFSPYPPGKGMEMWKRNNDSFENKLQSSDLKASGPLGPSERGIPLKMDQKNSEDKSEVFSSSSASFLPRKALGEAWKPDIFNGAEEEQRAHGIQNSIEKDVFRSNAEDMSLNGLEDWLSYADSASHKQKTLLKNTIKKNFLELTSGLVSKSKGFRNCLGSSYETYYSYKPFYSSSFQSSWQSRVRQTGFQNFESQATPMVQISSKTEIGQRKAGVTSSHDITSSSTKWKQKKGAEQYSKKCFLVNNIYPLPSLKWFLVQKTAYLGNQRFAGFSSGQNFISSKDISSSLNNKNFQRSFSKNSFLFYRFNLVLKNQTFANTDILSPFQGEFIESKRSKNNWWNQGSKTFLMQKQEKIKHEIFLTKKDMFCVLFPKFNHVFPSSSASFLSFLRLVEKGESFSDPFPIFADGHGKGSESGEMETKNGKKEGKIEQFRKTQFKKIIQFQFSLNLRPNNFKPVILHFDNFSRNSVFLKKVIMDNNKLNFISQNVNSQDSLARFSFPPISGGNGAGRSNGSHSYASEDGDMELIGFPKKQKPYISSLIKLCKKNIPLIRKPEFLDRFLKKDQTYQIDNFLTKYQKRLYKLKGLSVGKSNKFVDLRLGTFLFKGDLINSFTSFHKTGQILHLNSKKITLRYAQPFLVSAKGILHVHQGDPIFKNVPVITLPFDTFTTGDIVQGIPKVEQYLEARTTQNGRFFVYSLPVLLQGIFKRYCNKFPLDKAVSQSFLKIQLIIVDGVQRVYGSQGVSIADKHLEVIVKQMTSKVQIVHGGQTGFFPGELVDLELIERINPFLMVKIQYEPVVLGITRASLEAESFLSAASFQQTTKILAKSSLYKKKDFLKGLKENILIGNLIPAGTGYMNIL